jgi:hypothetical protein
MCSDSNDTQSCYELVHTVHDYYDGPRSGIANFQGHPHFYERIFDEEQDHYTELFRLTPIDEATFRNAMEDWNIWLRWEAAFYSAKATIDTHPALPEERARHEELASILENSLKTGPDAMIRIGIFLRPDPPVLPPGIRRHNQRVRWEIPIDKYAPSSS